MTIFEEFKNELGYSCEWNIIDNLVVSDGNIIRTVKGHAFELIF